MLVYDQYIYPEKPDTDEDIIVFHSGFCSTTLSSVFISLPDLFSSERKSLLQEPPSLSDKASRLICIPFLLASSIKLTQTTTRGDISNCLPGTRFRLRSRQVASQTTTTASGFPKQIKFLATSSSAE